MYANQHRYDYSVTIVALALERHRRMHCPDQPADAVAVAVLICPPWPCLCHPGQTTIYSRLFTNDCNRRWGTSTPRSAPPPLPRPKNWERAGRMVQCVLGGFGSGSWCIYFGPILVYILSAALITNVIHFWKSLSWMCSKKGSHRPRPAFIHQD